MNTFPVRLKIECKIFRITSALVRISATKFRTLHCITLLMRLSCSYLHMHQMLGEVCIAFRVYLFQTDIKKLRRGITTEDTSIVNLFDAVFNNLFNKSNHCLNHLLPVVRNGSHNMVLRSIGHQFKPRNYKSELARKSFIS